MADFDDDNYNNFGGGGDDGDNNNNQQHTDDADDPLTDHNASAVLEQQRDAVLFAVDCRSSMFSTTNQNNTTSVFRNAIRCARDFYQNKIIASPRDLVGLILYNTREQNNVHGFSNIYTFHPLDLTSASRILELSTLAQCGRSGTDDHMYFEQFIGFADKEKIPTSTTSENQNQQNQQQQNPDSASSSSSVCFRNVLWFARHAFAVVNGIDNASGIGRRRTKNYSNQDDDGIGGGARPAASAPAFAFKRIFLFTDDEDPTNGSISEKRQCLAELKTLCENRIGLSVFAHGKKVATGDQLHESMARSVATLSNTDATSSTGYYATSNNSNKNLQNNHQTQNFGAGAMAGASLMTSSSTANNNTVSNVSSPNKMSMSNNNNNNMMMMNNQRSFLSSTSASSNNDRTHTTATTNQTSSSNNITTNESSSSSASTFDKDKFWSSVLDTTQKIQNDRTNFAAQMNAAIASRGGSVMNPNNFTTSASDTDDATLTATNNADRSYDIKVEDSFKNLPGFIEALRIKTHPKRSLGSLRFMVGTRDDNCPRCVVSIFSPTMTCSKPKQEWIESDTNYNVQTETELVSSTTLERVQLDEILRAVHLGSTTSAAAAASSSATSTTVQTIPFTTKETKLVKLLSAPEGAGITILGFKSQKLLPQCKFSLQKCSFLHVHKTWCDLPGRSFFACLWRSLVDKELFAVGHIVTRHGSPGRLCLLIPTPPSSSSSQTNNNNNNPSPSHLLSKDYVVEGSGFYVKILPYAEDYRGEEIEGFCSTLAEHDAEEEKKNIQQKVEQHNSNPNNNNRNLTVDEEMKAKKDLERRQVKLMNKFVRKAMVKNSEFSLRKISNPALQKLYDQIENLAVGDAILDDDEDEDNENDDDQELPEDDDENENGGNNNNNDNLMMMMNNNNNINNQGKTNNNNNSNNKKQEKNDFGQSQIKWTKEQAEIYTRLRQDLIENEMKSSTNNGNNDDARTAQNIVASGGNRYNPVRLIMAASSTSTAKPPPAEAELAQIDFAGLHEAGKLQTLTLPPLKAFCKKQGLSIDGVKADILKRIGDFLSRNKESGQRRQRQE